MMNSAQQTQSFLMSQLENHPHDIVAFTVQSLGITRTTVLRHLKHLIDQGKILKTGTTKNTYYTLSNALTRRVIVNIPSDMGEFDVFRDNFSPLCSHLADNVVNICLYGVTEMINNAFDHANAKKVIVDLHVENSNIIFTIADDGIGIFKKISDYLHFDDIRESILQINKGKFTTDKKNHTGEGIFFTSRAFDQFSIASNGINYFQDNLSNDWFIESFSEKKPGTTVKLVINSNSKTVLKEIFLKFQNPETMAFDKTEIIVELSRLGEDVYISRSQAKRVLMNLNEFNVITLDFKGVRTVGQGFADEVFRVYQNEHPHTQINYLNANDDVIFMIKRALASAGENS